MAFRLEGLSVTNPKGLNAEASLSLDSSFSVELALTVTTLLVVDDVLLLQQYVLDEMARLRVGVNTAEKTITGFVISGRGYLKLLQGKRRASTVQGEHNQQI